MVHFFVPLFLFLLLLIPIFSCLLLCFIIFALISFPAVVFIPFLWFLFLFGRLPVLVVLFGARGPAFPAIAIVSVAVARVPFFGSSLFEHVKEESVPFGNFFLEEINEVVLGIEEEQEGRFIYFPYFGCFDAFDYFSDIFVVALADLDRLRIIDSFVYVLIEQLFICGERSSFLRSLAASCLLLFSDGFRLCLL